jgi:4-diphosphocytidyl-2-C-methyl-D-erythritol kinase
MSETIRLHAMAKLNLFLRVTGTHDDGFHQLETIFHGIGLYDVLELREASPGVIGVCARGPAAVLEHLPASRENLVSIAASRVAEMAERPVGTDIVVTKNIPIGAGLAGGSADAAGTIIGLIQLWNLKPAPETVLEVAAGLGSDVPFCVQGGTALATGRGTDLTRLPQPPPMWFVLGISDTPLLTATVYDAWEREGTTGESSADGMMRALGQGNPAAIAKNLHNDLLSPATTVRPEIRSGLEAFLDAGALGASMSGSGPTVFGIAADQGHALELAHELDPAFSRVEVVSSAPAGVERG